MTKLTKDKRGHLHVHLAGHRVSKALTADMLGTVRTVARGHRTISLARKVTDKKASDMSKEKFAQLKALLDEFFGEEAKEPEHAADCNGKDDCGCGCTH